MYNKKPKLTKKKVSKNKMKKSSKKKLSTISKKKNIQRGGSCTQYMPKSANDSTCRNCEKSPNNCTDIKSRKAIRQGTYQPVDPEEVDPKDPEDTYGTTQEFYGSKPDFHHQFSGEDLYATVPSNKDDDDDDDGEGIDYNFYENQKAFENFKEAEREHHEAKEIFTSATNAFESKKIMAESMKAGIMKTQMNNQLEILKIQLDDATENLKNKTETFKNLFEKFRKKGSADRKKGYTDIAPDASGFSSSDESGFSSSDLPGYTDVAPDAPDASELAVETLRKELAVETLTEPKVYKAEKRMEYKTKQILFHFNMFKHMVIQKDLELYNLENVNMNGDLSTLDAFYFYNNNKIENVIIDKDKTQPDFMLQPDYYAAILCITIQLRY